jgi:hypothetical protein
MAITSTTRPVVLDRARVDPPRPTAPARPGVRLSPTSARITITPTWSATAHPEAEPSPAFLELVGRLAAAYCPPLLSTDVVEVARWALVGHGRSAMDEVESVARAALDVVVSQPAARTPDDGRQP